MARWSISSPPNTTPASASGEDRSGHGGAAALAANAHGASGSPEYLARSPPLRGPEDLAQHQCVRVRFPAVISHRSFCRATAKVARSISAARSSPTILACKCKRRATASAWLTTLYDYIAADIESGALKVLLQEWMPQPVDLATCTIEPPANSLAAASVHHLSAQGKAHRARRRLKDVVTTLQMQGAPLATHTNVSRCS